MQEVSTSFQSLGLSQQLLSNLFNMGFKNPTPIQEKSIPGALSGRDVLGQAATGTGKTGAFAVPLVNALLSKPTLKGLVLVPTRELAAQIFKVMRQMTEETRIRGALVVGGESFNQQQRILSGRGGVNYIIATPGRLMDHLERGRLSLDSIGMLILDEVDRMVDMGFAPQLKEIMRHVPEGRQTLLFSATLPGELMGMVNRYVKDPLKVTIGNGNAPAANITEREVKTTASEKNALLLGELNALEGRVLVFTRTKHRADRLAVALQKEGLRVAKLHGGRSQAQRRFALQGFKSGDFRILVATDVAGRGIDVDDIGAVINYDMPATRDDYIHRIGRTGRYGKAGQAINFVSPEDRNTAQSSRQRPGGGGRPFRKFSGGRSRRPGGGSRGGFRKRA